MVDAFTHDHTHAEGYPIAKASQYMPEWWKSLPTELPDYKEGYATVKSGTMKRCRGFRDFYANSFVVPLWSDLAVEMQVQMEQKIWRYKFADQVSELHVHDEGQFAGFVDYRHYQQFKFISRWRLKESKGIKFLVTHPTYNLGDSLFTWQVIPGMLDFKNQNSLEVNTIWQYPKQEGIVSSTLIEADTAIAQIVPLTERTVKIKTHLISLEEYNRKFFSLTKFNGQYKENERINNRNQKRSCPFH